MASAKNNTWTQFERRMRLRRQETCMAALREAMAAGDYRAALERATELSTLDPSWNEMRATLEQMVAQTPQKQVTTAKPEPPPVAPQKSEPGQPTTRAATSPAKTPTTAAPPTTWSTPAATRKQAATVASQPAGDVTIRKQARLSTYEALAPAVLSRIGEEEKRRTWPKKAAFAVAACALAFLLGWEGPRLFMQRGEPTSLPAQSSAEQQPSSSAQSAAQPAVVPPQPVPPLPPSTAAAGKQEVTQPREQQPQRQSMPPPVQRQATAGPAQHIGASAAQQSGLPIQAPTSQAAPTTGRADASTGNAAGTAGTDRLASAAEVKPPATPPVDQVPLPSTSLPTANAGSTTSTGSTSTSGDATASTAVTGGSAAAAGTEQVSPPPERDATADNTRPSSPAMTEQQSIRNTLAAYQSAYESLDASAVRQVWPRVNEDALRSAFGGLRSQRVAFSGCTIEVRGLHAAAVCQGVASYVPKVGSDEAVSVHRTWLFSLRKQTEERWIIESATSR